MGLTLGRSIMSVGLRDHRCDEKIELSRGHRGLLEPALDKFKTSHTLKYTLEISG